MNVTIAGRGLGVLVSIAVSAAGFAAAADAKVARGPKGDAFYKPPAKLVRGRHGSLVWARNATSERLGGAASNTIVLYRSVTPSGKPTVVSGVISVPKGTAPAGGWPVISYGHGSGGVNDSFAPSKNPGLYGDSVAKALARWVQAGYVVVMTDYQGLGTAGQHPYLIGAAETRAMSDIVRAARGLDSHIGKRFVTMGHDEGGHAALFAAAQAARWTPELSVLGAVTLAPVTHVREVDDALRASSTPTGLAGYLPLVLRGAQTAGVNPIPLLTSRAANLLALTEKTPAGAFGQLVASYEWGGIPPNQIFREDADLTRLNAVLTRNEASDLAVKVPVFAADLSASAGKPLTDDMVARLRSHGASVDERIYDTPLADPSPATWPVVEASFADASAFVNGLFGH